MTSDETAGASPDADGRDVPPEHTVDRVDVAAISQMAAAVTLSVVVLVAVAGIVWGLLAPGVTGVVVSGDRAGFLPADTGHRFDAIAMFACISFVAGVLAGVGAWWVRGLRGPAGVVAVTSGAMGGAAAGVWLGGLVAGTRHPGVGRTPAGQYFQTAPSLRLDSAGLDTLGGLDLSWAIVVVAPIGALLAYLVLLVAVRRADLGVPRPAGATDLDPGASGWGTQGRELVGDPQTVLGEPVERGRPTP